MSGDAQRIDKWLWFARFFKTRTLATRFCQSGRLRINGETIHKAHQSLRIGDVLTFPKGPHVRVIRVAALGERRGPAREAALLYEDLQPPVPKAARDANAAAEPAVPRREPGAGRPTKAERRAIDRLKGEG